MKFYECFSKTSNKQFIFAIPTITAFLEIKLIPLRSELFSYPMTSRMNTFPCIKGGRVQKRGEVLTFESEIPHKNIFRPFQCTRNCLALRGYRLQFQESMRITPLRHSSPKKRTIVIFFWSTELPVNPVGLGRFLKQEADIFATTALFVMVVPLNSHCTGTFYNTLMITNLICFSPLQGITDQKPYRDGKNASVFSTSSSGKYYQEQISAHSSYFTDIIFVFLNTSIWSF